MGLVQHQASLHKGSSQEIPQRNPNNKIHKGLGGIGEFFLGGWVDRDLLHHSSKYGLDWMGGDGDPLGLSSATMEER